MLVRNFNRLVFVVLLLLISAMVLIFVLENQVATSLSFLGWSLPSLSLAVYILVAFCVGLVFGFVGAFYSCWRLKKNQPE